MSANKYSKFVDVKTSLINKYKDLFEGIGHQLVVRIMSPSRRTASGNTTGLPNFTYYHSSNITQATAGFKQITGCVTITYMFTVACLVACLGLVWLIWPDERELLTSIVLTIVPCMIIFTACLLGCCVYLNRRHLLLFTGSLSRSNTPPTVIHRFDDEFSLAGNGHEVSIAMPIGGTKSGGEGVAGGRVSPFYRAGGAALMQPVPVWQPPTYEELTDESPPDYDAIKARQNANKARLEFLKYTD